MTRGIQQFILVRYRMLITMVWSVVYASLIPTHTHTPIAYLILRHCALMAFFASTHCVWSLVRLTAVDQGRHNP